MENNLLEVSYIGEINLNQDVHIKSSIPYICSKFNIECEFDYQESSSGQMYDGNLKKYVHFRLIGFRLKNKLSDFERLKLSSLISMIFDTSIFITKI